MTEPTSQPVTYADGGNVYFTPSNPGPVLQARFADGVLVEFRQITGTAHVRFRGVEVKKIPLDVDADIDCHGEWASFIAFKTGIAGADGGMDIPGDVRNAAISLCRRRAREARQAMRSRQPVTLTS